MPPSDPQRQQQQQSVNEQLAAFGPGLTEEVLRQVVAQGEGARHRVHKFDPPGAGGWEAYRTRIRTARMVLFPFKWVPNDELGCAMVRNPAGNRRILIARGNEKTGLENELPTTFYKKGYVLRQATRRNAQLSFDGPGFVSELEEQHPEGEENGDDVVMETWVLLVYTDEFLDKDAGKKRIRVRWELSMPIAWEGDRPSDWERINLPEFPIEFALTEDELPDFASEDDLDIELKKKE